MRCASCGLTNFASSTHCRRCGAALTDGSGYAQESWQPADAVGDWRGASRPVYGAPAVHGAYGQYGQTSGVWTDGDQVVVHEMAVLPDRCVKCNAPAGGRRLKRRFSWHSPLLYLLILAGALVYIIVAAIVSSRATLELGVCEKHATRRQACMIAASLLTALCLVSVVLSIGNESLGLAAIGALAGLGAIVTGLMVSGWVSAAKIADGYVWLKGTGREYRAALPPMR